MYVREEKKNEEFGNKSNNMRMDMWIHVSVLVELRLMWKKK